MEISCDAFHKIKFEEPSLPDCCIHIKKKTLGNFTTSHLGVTIFGMTYLSKINICQWQHLNENNVTAISLNMTYEYALSTT
jgi:hypothetical protein